MSYKARLCVRGCKQIYGINYEDTYAPVVKYELLRILFALTTHLDLELVRFDVEFSRTNFHGGILKTSYHRLM